MHEEGRQERFHCAVLGPLRVHAPDGAEVTPAGVLPKKLLALLVLRRGAVVSADAAIELLWPVDGPNNPVAALHNQVSRLRRVVPIASTGDGYRVDPDHLVVDADELAAILDGGGSAEEILRRWVGPAYPELEMVDDARAESARLEELRVRAHESEAARLLAEGRTDGVAARLRALVDEHPLREHLRALLIDALVATGRHADALRVYDEFRRLLAAELGTEPSEPLRARYRRLLAGEVETDAPQPLPMPVTALIGRDELLAQARAVSTDHRLVTLVGPGGVGKTRLMLELGRGHTGSPVVWCELAPADLAGAVTAVAAALAIDVRPGIPLDERIAGVIHETEMLVLLDNCEHVIEPIAALVDLLLRRCPKLRIVATSRERLRVAGEQVRRVPPLAVGDGSPAVALFLERAASVTGDLPLAPATVAQVGAIVSRLDGLPLAIELAAARMYSHEVDEIAAGLDRQFDFLSAGYRTATRHGSLAAAVAWSVDLLDRGLRETFTSLSVFAGPFDVAAAAAVCGIELGVAADGLTALTERSLVLRAPGRRYALLETLRTFGRTARAAADDGAGARHAAYFVDWAERTCRELADSATAITRIDDTVTELHRALHWLLDHGDTPRAARLVAALMDYGLLRLRPDVLAWSELVLAAETSSGHDGADLPAGGFSGRLAAEVLAAAAYARWMAGDLVGAYDRAGRALAACADPPYNAYGAYGVCELFSGRFAESAQWYRRAAEIPGRETPNMDTATWTMLLGYAGDPSVGQRCAELATVTAISPYTAYLLYCAGEAVLDVDPDRAREMFDRALRMAEATGTTFVTGVAGASRASLDVRSGRTAEAAAAYPALLRAWQRAGMWSTQWVMLRSIALLLEQLGRPQRAAVLDGAIRAATTEQPLGTDREVLDQLSTRLRKELGDNVFEHAQRFGASLGNDALIGYTLAALGPPP
ncbi:BTAD domain-containing putative transcriptional regulator [Nocardia caishijiensis]|uniref:ATPase n=1 Tax=Nocardia caishijiensis TaxID=184756 RepID=A0ABQ6YQN4_9NOCA|nr:BTAD domain-containing putative transcriptional regulator [Nocardia caishijiensis]KAF0848112.1 putative ATPase [Nocardia caishijiensis]